MLKVKVEPTEELITVEEAAEFMRAEFSREEESLIKVLIRSARIWCENYLRRAIGIQTLELTLDSFPANGQPILLRPPTNKIIEVQYRDSYGGQYKIWDSSEYMLCQGEPDEMRSLSGAYPPTQKTSDAVKILFETGYNQGSPLLTEHLPETIRVAILLQVADLYANREAQTERPLIVNQALEKLLSTYRLEMGQ